MRNYINLITGFIFFVLLSCGSQTTTDPKVVSSLLQSEEFTFVAKRAHPTNYDVINVMNSLPHSSASRMLDLDGGYDIVVKKGELVSTLPYFGRTYTPSMDREKESMRFTSKAYKLTKTDGKKGATVLYFAPSDVSHIRRVIMEVFPNGKAYVSIDANDRQAISYDGYIQKNN